MPRLSRLVWYARRLRTMDPAEIVWRAGRVPRDLAEPAVDLVATWRLGRGGTGRWERALADFRAARGRPVLLERERAVALRAERPDAAADVVAAAERVRQHRMRYLGYPEVFVGDPVDWHRDAVTGFRWPLGSSRRLDHRTAPADPKWVWELNRLQHLPWLAQAWLMTDRSELADEALRQIDAWIEQNPFGRGIAWRGGFEAGIRAMSVLVALQGVRDCESLTVDRFRRVVTMLDRSARLCWAGRSRHSSANNHLVGEMAGLAVIGLLLPELPGARRRVRRAVRVLREEAERQVLPDGASAEQSVAYQLFTVELLLVVMVLLRADGRAVPPELDRALRRSGDFLADLVAGGDPAPRYGDDDQGFALRLDAEEARTVTTHLAIVAAYLGQDEAPPPAGGLTAGWLQAARPRPRTARPLLGRTPGDLYAAHGGLVVLRRGDHRLTVDVGPLGYLAIAAHGHADALSVTWSAAGREVIGDPGTGSYYGHPEWRRSHRSTAAHATVEIDGQDQSVMAGPFMWSRHAGVRTHHVDLERGLVDAEHDGYLRLERPVRHRRVVQVLDDLGGFLVVDLVLPPEQGAGTGATQVARPPGPPGRSDPGHRAVVSWPLAPDLGADVVPGGHVVVRDGRPVAHLVAAGTVPLAHDVVRGDATTHLGWWSDRLEQRRPSSLLRTTALGAAPYAVATLVVAVATDGDVAPAPERLVPEVTVDLASDEARVSWTALGRTTPGHVRIGLTADSGGR